MSYNLGFNPDFEDSDSKLNRVIEILTHVLDVGGLRGVSNETIEELVQAFLTKSELTELWYINDILYNTYIDLFMSGYLGMCLIGAGRMCPDSIVDYVHTLIDVIRIDSGLTHGFVDNNNTPLKVKNIHSYRLDDKCDKDLGVVYIITTESGATHCIQISSIGDVKYSLAERGKDERKRLSQSKWLL
jgi:hypothetical protein